jgi:SAM-dependent methyltransferase
MRTSNVDLSRVTELPPHLIEAVQEVTRSDYLMLDFGCGRNVHKDLIEALEAGYVGIDIRAGAMVRGDAHRLPFSDAVFDGAISTAVLEHLQNPFIATAELYRVLKPGAYFFGVVAFLEPFHDSSYCHLSHLGTRSVLESSGFQVEHMWPGISILDAFFDDLFRGWPIFLLPAVTIAGRVLDFMRAGGVNARLLAARLVGRRGVDKSAIDFTIAGSIGFIARKPIES